MLHGAAQHGPVLLAWTQISITNDLLHVQLGLVNWEGGMDCLVDVQVWTLFLVYSLLASFESKPSFHMG